LAHLVEISIQRRLISARNDLPEQEQGKRGGHPLTKRGAPEDRLPDMRCTRFQDLSTKVFHPLPDLLPTTSELNPRQTNQGDATSLDEAYVFLQVAEEIEVTRLKSTLNEKRRYLLRNPPNSL